jgi:hypothetical protein
MAYFLVKSEVILYTDTLIDDLQGYVEAEDEDAAARIMFTHLKKRGFIRLGRSLEDTIKVITEVNEIPYRLPHWKNPIRRRYAYLNSNGIVVSE